MTLVIAAGAWDPSSAGASVDPVMPASPQAGDLHVLYVCVKPYTTTITDPSGWTKITNTDGTNGTVASGSDAGSIKQIAYYRYWQSGDPTTPSVGFSGASVGLGVIIRFRPTAGSTINTPVGEKGSDVSSGTDYAATMGSDIGIAAGDAVAAFTTIAGNNSTFGSPTLSATGVTFGTVTENPATEGSTSSGDDLAASASTALPSAGPSSAAAVVGWTLSVAQTGMTALVRIRESAASIAVNQTTETDTSQPVSKIKNRVAGQVSETDLAQAVGKLKYLGALQALESDSAQTIARLKIYSVAQVTETDLAQPISSTPPDIIPVGQTTETDAAQAIARLKNNAVVQVTESDAAQAISRQKIRTIAQVVETDAAQALAVRKIKAVLQVVETDSAQAIIRLKSRAIAQVSESDLAQAILQRKIKSLTQVTEADLAQPILSTSAILIVQVEETDLAQALFPLKRVAVAQAVEVDLAQALGIRRIRAIGQVTEIDLAQLLTSAGTVEVILGIAYLSDSLVDVATLSDAILWTAALSELARESASVEDEPL